MRPRTRPGSPRAFVVIAGIVALSAGTGCVRAMRSTVVTPGNSLANASLWQEPHDLPRRDLLHGPGGQALVPRDPSYELVAQDATGYSPGLEVRDGRGLLWSVKLGPEAQSEVTTSRVLWAIGFHQPPTYYIAKWRLAGGEQGDQPPGRFRPELRTEKVVGEWSWYENPFVGTRAFGGLIVANLILTSWDWKTSNNKIYADIDHSASGQQRFVVRDLGASLGKFTYPTLLRLFRLRGFGQGTRNDLAGFEEQGFIKRIADRDVDFHYRGIYSDVVNSVTPEDVAWTCVLLARLSDVQWRDAFRAGGYDANQSSRYIAKIKSKIAEGQRLTRPKESEK
jgi:hypothetical protein